jgi:hypothetical protein
MKMNARLAASEEEILIMSLRRAVPFLPLPGCERLAPRPPFLTDMFLRTPRNSEGVLEEIFEAITDKIACLYKCAEAIALLDMVAACVDSHPLSPLSICAVSRQAQLD